MNTENLCYDSNIVTDLLQVLGEYSFRLTEIPETEIKVKLYRYVGSSEICFETSHYIKTPEQCGAYMTNRNYAGSEEAALERAIHTITDFYRTAVENGNIPEPSWLEVNTLY